MDASSWCDIWGEISINQGLVKEVDKNSYLYVTHYFNFINLYRSQKPCI